MDTMEKQHFALKGRTDIAAAAIRVTAARRYAGLTQPELSGALNRGVSAISNTERARSFPPWDLMVYFLKEHRIDINFIVAGEYAQLPADVQEHLFDELKSVHDKTDLLESSDLDRNISVKLRP